MWAVELYSRNKSIRGADESNPTPSIRIRRDCGTLPNSALPLVSNPSNIPPNPTHPTAKLLKSCAAMFLQKGPGNYFRNVTEHPRLVMRQRTHSRGFPSSKLQVPNGKRSGTHLTVLWPRIEHSDMKHNVMCIFDNITRKSHAGLSNRGFSVGSVFDSIGLAKFRRAWVILDPFFDRSLRLTLKDTYWKIILFHFSILWKLHFKPHARKLWGGTARAWLINVHRQNEDIWHWRYSVICLQFPPCWWCCLITLEYFTFSGIISTYEKHWTSGLIVSDLALYATGLHLSQQPLVELQDANQCYSYNHFME